MSNSGQAVLGIVGAVVGFVVGGPTGAVYGFQLGYLAGTALFPTQLPALQGPRLGDGQQTVSQVGAPIAWIFGTQCVGGNAIWASPIREVSDTQTAGKGGPEQDQTTYRYFRSWSILLCEGPIAGVRRVWANGKLVYDVRPQQDDESAEEFQARHVVNAQFTSKVVIYLGTEDQMPDPVMESFEGVGQVPAHRGYAHMVFDDVELKAEDGNRIPAQWKIEVYTDGAEAVNELDEYANERFYPWHVNTIDPRNSGNTHLYGTTGGTGDQTLASVSAAISAAGTGATGYLMEEAELRGWYPTAGNGNEIMPHDEDVTSTERVAVAMWYARWPSPSEIRINVAGDGDKCASWPSCGDVWWSHVTGDSFDMHATYQVSENGVCENAFGAAPGSQHGICFGDRRIWQLPDGRVWVARFPSPPDSTCSTLLPDFPGYCIDVNGMIVSNVAWEYDDTTTYRALRSYADTNTIVTSYPLDPIRPLGHSEYSDQAFWEAAYELEVARGTMSADLVYGVDYPMTQSYGYRKQASFDSVEVAEVSLATIVSAVCERVGLTEYDVSDLEDQFVDGYQVTRPIAARGAIEPLRSVGFFDAVESGIVMRFPTRGKANTFTVNDDDLAAHFSGEERPSRVTTSKKQEVELPRQLRVHYQNTQRDFEPGEEPSPERFDTAAESIVDVELAVAISAEKAARIAEVIFRDIWASRWTHGISLDQAYSDIEPSDCGAVPVDGVYQRSRVMSVTDRLPNLRSFEIIRDDDGAYVSYAVANSSLRPPSRIQFYGPAEMVLLDLPALSDEDDNAGIYLAARPYVFNGAFKGVVVSRSSDGGGSYQIVGSATTATTMGKLVSALPIGPSTIFDEGNELIVELQYGDLESLTEEAILGGANAAAIGVDGRWEIVQFIAAENIAGSVWRLTGLLRGRRGTEHAIGLSISGDRFVMLSEGALARIPLSLQDVGQSMLYRATVIGSSSAAVDPTAFTGQGVALKPFSPVHIVGERNEAGDLAIEWVRRNRLGGDLETTLSEVSEDYEIEILNAASEALRTISTTETSAVYSSAQQIVDFGSIQPDVEVRIYQISATVDRGYPGIATL